MGDPDVPSHWPMVSREGLDWRSLTDAPSFKNELLSQRLDSDERERVNSEQRGRLSSTGGITPDQDCQQPHFHGDQTLTGSCWD